ncbi:hypothetical protein Q5752_000414 [Cryptotrichosporon argae]
MLMTDDIYPTFGDAPSPSANTTTFEKQIQTYWLSFIKNLDPTATSHTSWKAYTSTEGDATGVFALGGDGLVEACPSGFWGTEAEFDFQLYA